MPRVLVIALLAGCAPLPPEIGIDVSPVNMGVRSTDPELEARHFDLQIFNRGEEALVIEMPVVFRGDQNCSFEFEGPDADTLGQDESAFIRGWYKPTVAGEDQIAMEVSSNAENFPLLIVPICGLGVEPGTEDAEPIDCVVPPEDQPDC